MDTIKDAVELLSGAVLLLLKITPEFNDKVFITCMRCHAVSHIALKTSKEVDEPTEP